MFSSSSYIYVYCPQLIRVKLCCINLEVWLFILSSCSTFSATSLCSNPVFVVHLSPVNQPCASMPDVENQQIITFQFWLQSKIPWKCLLIFRALQNLLPFGPQALWRGGRPCENEVWPRGKLPLYWLWKKQIWEQQQNIWEAFLLQVEVVTKSVEGVVTLHVLWRGGEGRAAGVLVYFSRRHDRELPCTDTHTNTHIQQLV